MKKIVAVIISMLICLPAQSAAPEQVSARSAVLMDAASGRLLWEKNGFEQLSMASTTKIMTAILAIENCDLSDIAVVSPVASGVEGSSLWLEPGERLTVEQLLYGLMLRSGNDAAVALAEQTAGNVEAFVLLMNAKAKEIGMFNTSFETPNGLDSDKHYTTAYDMAILACYAMKNPDFRRIVSTKEMQIPWEGKQWNRSLTNHNKLLWRYEGCTGVKTGFTRKSGRCLVSAAQRDGREIICVTLNAPNDWDDHARLLDHGFEDFETAVLTKKGEKWETVTVREREIGLVCGEDFVASLKPGEAENVELRSDVSEIVLPVSKGQTMGRLYIFSGGEFLGGVDLLADRDAGPEGLRDHLRKIAKGMI